MRRPSGEYSCLPAFGGGEDVGDIHAVVTHEDCGRNEAWDGPSRVSSFANEERMFDLSPKLRVTLRNIGSSNMLEQCLFPKRLQVYAPAVLSKEAVLQTNNVAIA